MMCREDALLPVVVEINAGRFQSTPFSLENSSLAPAHASGIKRKLPSAVKIPTGFTSLLEIPAHNIRRTVATRIPMRVARLRCSDDKPAAARPMTTALSPARTRSIITTCIKVVTAPLPTISKRVETGRLTQSRLNAPTHSITSFARARSLSGILRPSSFAVVRLMIRSNSVGCSTGISAGFVPRSILSTRSAARRHMLGQFGP